MALAAQTLDRTAAPMVGYGPLNERIHKDTLQP
jgi:hypothetical protein